MNALLSGRAGTALLIEDAELSSITAGALGSVVPRRLEEIHLLFGEARDLQVLEGVDRAEVGRLLDREADAADALQICLILLDPELPDEIRQEAAGELDEFLVGQDLAERLEQVLYAHALPSAADLEGAQTLSAGTLHVQKFLGQISALQTVIVEVNHAWVAVPDATFPSAAERGRFQAAAIRTGLFRDLVLARSKGFSPNSVLVSALLNPALQTLRGQRAALQAWVAPLRQDSSYPIHALPVSEVAEEPIELRRRPRRGGDRQAILEKVTVQKDAALEALENGELDRFREYVADLVDFQSTYGGPRYAVKSLCDLASRAKDLGFTALQLELTTKSIQVKPDDGWAWAQHGDALLYNSQLEEALVAFSNAISFGNLAAGGVGRGEVLRSMGKMEEALGAYEETIERFPEEVVAINGRAEVLRSLSRNGEALAAYEETISRFPEDVFARTGRAETLRSLSRNDEALAAYEETILRFSENLFARTGRAETLRSLGRFDEALAAYDALIERHPFDLVARNGRASVLLDMGLFEKALDQLPLSKPILAQDWIGFHIRGMVLLRMGDFDAAEHIFREGVVHDPLPRHRDYFRTALAILWLRRRDSLAACTVLEEIETSTLEQEVNLLRFHAYIAEGRIERASSAERRLLQFRLSPQVEEVRVELLRRFVDRLPPAHSDDWLLEREVAILRAA